MSDYHPINITIPAQYTPKGKESESSPSLLLIPSLLNRNMEYIDEHKADIPCASDSSGEQLVQEKHNWGQTTHHSLTVQSQWFRIRDIK